MTPSTKRSRSKDIFISYFKAILLSVVLAFLIRGSIVSAYIIPSGSMEDTLQIGDQIMVSKFHYGLRIPMTHWALLSGHGFCRGDVIVFEKPDKNTNYVKRIIGLPGDRVEIVDKTVRVNDLPLDEPYVRHDDPVIWPSLMGVRDNFGPIVVPPGCLFVMGDNRDHSYDSRYWGFVDFSLVQGKATIRLWSWDAGASRMRWSRLLTWID